jgi:hypothetical protein
MVKNIVYDQQNYGSIGTSPLRGFIIGLPAQKNGALPQERAAFLTLDF